MRILFEILYVSFFVFKVSKDDQLYENSTHRFNEENIPWRMENRLVVAKGKK